jgi:hypothetical protein
MVPAGFYAIGAGRAMARPAFDACAPGFFAIPALRAPGLVAASSGDIRRRLCARRVLSIRQAARVTPAPGPAPAPPRAPRGALPRAPYAQRLDSPRRGMCRTCSPAESDSCPIHPSASH